jgi:sterol desaturase/sphingolipid hydroxylase (fatty acid hydroxylase superfamily)
MRLSKIAYFADFAIYSVILALLLVLGLRGADPAVRIHALSAVVFGMLAWTLFEYVLHRFVLHGGSRIAPLHTRHHELPRAYIGTPTWLSTAVIAIFVFLPGWLGLSLNTGAGLTAGVVIGFLWYGLAHHAIHHRQPRFLAAWLAAASRRHFRHHGSSGAGNFGVTTPLWDRLFGTCLGRYGSTNLHDTGAASSK